MVQDVRTIKLTFISDFYCPWCYLGYREIRAAMDKCAANKLPVTFDVEYRPFLLNPTLSEESGIPRLEYLQSKLGVEKANMVDSMIQDRARAFGINNMKAGPIRSTMRAHRLVLRAYALGGTDAQSKLLARIFEAYSLQERDVGDPDTLAELTQDVGLMSREEAMEFLQSDDLSSEVSSMVEKARQDGVTGVPFTVVDSKWAISGGQTPDVYYQIFAKLAGLPADGSPTPAES